MDTLERGPECDPVAVQHVGLIAVLGFDKGVEDYPEGVQARPELPGSGCQRGYDLFNALVMQKPGQGSRSLVEVAPPQLHKISGSLVCDSAIDRRIDVRPER